MDNLNLLNALYFFLYWLLELVKTILAFLVVPVQILYAYLTMHIPLATAYSRQIVSMRWNKLKTFGVTLKLTMDHQKPHLTVHSYDEEAQEASKTINETKFTTIHAKIRKGLEEARKYLFVIFQTNDSAVTFIQLRSDTDIYLFDFPLSPKTLNRDYAIEVIDYLRAQGFTKTKPGTDYKSKSYCIDAIDDEMTTIQANLGRDQAFVADFCTRIFKNIFHVTTIPEVIFG